MADDPQVGITEDTDQYFKVRQADGNELTFAKVPGNMGVYTGLKSLAPGGGSDAAPDVSQSTPPPPNLSQMQSLPPPVGAPPPTSTIPNNLLQSTPQAAVNVPPPLIAAPVPPPQAASAPLPVPGDVASSPPPVHPMAKLAQENPENNMHTVQSSDTTRTDKGVGLIGGTLLGNAVTSSDKAATSLDAAIKAKDLQDQIQNSERYEQIQAQEDDFKKRQQIAQKQTEKLRNDMDTIGRRYNEMSIDSNRLFGDGETGNRILGALALALGSIATGMSGHDYLTTINGIIDGAIKRDIDVQKTNKENVKSEYEMKRGAYQDFMQQTKDDNLATQAEYARELEKASAFFGASADRLKLQDPQRAAQVAQVKADLDNKLAVAHAGIDATMLTKQTQVKAAPMELSPQPVQDKVKDLLKENDNIGRISDIYAALKERGDSTGPLSGRLLELKNQLGWGDADEGQFMQMIQQNFLNVGHAIGGAKAANPSEGKLIQKTTFNELMSSPAFERIMKTAYNDNEKEINATVAGEQAAGHFIPIKSWRQYYQPGPSAHTSPATYFTPTFTPRPAAK